MTKASFLSLSIGVVVKLSGICGALVGRHGVAAAVGATTAGRVTGTATVVGEPTFVAVGAVARLGDADGSVVAAGDAAALVFAVGDAAALVVAAGDAGALVVAVCTAIAKDPKPPAGAATGPGATVVEADVGATVVVVAAAELVGVSFVDTTDAGTVGVVAPATALDPLTVVVDPPGFTVVVDRFRISWARIASSEGSVCITGRNRSSAVWPTI